VVVKRQRIRRLPVGHIRLVACTYCAHAAPCCAVRCDTLLTGSAEHSGLSAQCSEWQAVQKPILLLLPDKASQQ
jgi:hypothetical protein